MSLSRMAGVVGGLAALCLCLSACGIKPSHVAPPPGAEDTRFPAIYPDISTDPRPESGR